MFKMKLEFKLIIPLMIGVGLMNPFALSNANSRVIENQHKTNSNYSQKSEAVIPNKFDSEYLTRKYSRKI